MLSVNGKLVNEYLAPAPASAAIKYKDLECCATVIRGLALYLQSHKAFGIVERCALTPTLAERKAMKKALLAALCLLAIAIDASSADDTSCLFAADPETTVNADGASRVKIVHRIRGNITVRGLGRKKGTDLVTRYSVGASNLTDIDGFQLVTQKIKGTVRVEAQTPELANVSVPGDSCPPRVDLWVNVPRQVDVVVIEAGDGDIDVRNLNTSLRVSHGSGDLKVRAVDDVVVVESGSGKVDIQDVLLDVDIKKKRRGKIKVKDVLGDIFIDKRFMGSTNIEESISSITINGVTFGGRKMQAY